MSEVAGTVEAYESSTEPTIVVGNDEGDSGSLRAPQTQGLNMTAVGSAVDGVGLLVVEWQSMEDGRGRRRLADRILEMLKPAIEDAVSGFKGTASVSVEDLEQVGAIAVFKLMRAYRYERRGSTTFTQTAKARVRSRCADVFRRTANVVNVSDWGQRGRKTVNGVDTAPQKPKNAAKLQIEVETAEAPLPDDVLTPEQLLDNAQTRQRMMRALNKLSPERRALVRSAFGIGQDTVSPLRSLVAKGEASANLEEALSELKGMLR